MLAKFIKTGTDKNYIRRNLAALIIVFVCTLMCACGKDNNNTDNDAGITKKTDTNETINNETGNNEAGNNEPDNNANNIDNTDDKENMTVDFINVGKGDCMVICTNSHVYMIDTGYKETSEAVETFLDSKEIKTIDGLIITHYDKDHVGGATDIIKKYDVKKIYMPDYVDTGDKYAKFMEKLEKWNKTNLISYVRDIVNITDGKMIMDIYPPKKASYEKENDYSLVTKITNGEDTFLFAGDAEEERLGELIGDDMINVDVLKVPYHGHLSDNSIKFLDEVSPKYSVITCDSESEVSTSIIYELQDLGSTYYFNSDGNIHCISYGDGNIDISQ